MNTLESGHFHYRLLSVHLFGHFKIIMSLVMNSVSYIGDCIRVTAYRWCYFHSLRDEISDYLSHSILTAADQSLLTQSAKAGQLQKYSFEVLLKTTATKVLIVSIVNDALTIDPRKHFFLRE